MKLSIDLGSTEFKAAIFADDDPNKAIGSGTHPVEYAQVEDEAKVELTPNSVKSALISLVSKAAESANIALEEITAVGVASQAQTFMLTDESFVPRTNFISWLDQRATVACDAMKTNPVFTDFAEHSTIAELAAPMRICLLKHLAMVSPDKFSENVRILPLPSYLTHLISGEFVTDANLAAMSGLYSLKERGYLDAYLAEVDSRISRESLPRVIDMGARAGTALPGNVLGLRSGIPVFSCGNDQTAGAYGADLEPGDILITLGTAQIAYACLNTMPVPALGLFRGFYPENHFYAMFAEMGGALISTALKQNPEFGDYANFAKLAEAASFNPTVTCELNEQKNTLVWSDEFASSAEKARAVLEFLTDRMAEMVTSLKKIAGAPRNTYITGGGARREIWVKMLADKIGRVPTKVNTSPENGIAKLIR